VKRRRRRTWGGKDWGAGWGGGSNLVVCGLSFSFLSVS